MENELISKETEEKIINDLKQLAESGKKGSIKLSDYINTKQQTSCLDFAMLYESSDVLQYLVQEQRQKGVRIDIDENEIFVS